jgi:AraC family transcriptional activator of pobA
MRQKVPTYGLYGEASEAVPDFWIHSELISDRSSRYKWEIKQHKHEFLYQILHIRAGTGDALIGKELYRLTAGSLVFMPEKVSHGFRFSPDVDGQVLTVTSKRLPLHIVSNAQAAAFVSEARIVRLDPDHEDTSFIQATLGKIQQEIGSSFGARNGLVEAYLGVVLALIIGMVLDAETRDNAADRDAQRITRLNDLINGHFREHLPVEFYARELGISVTHLNRITKAQTSKTMNDLLSEKIVSQAKRDLAFTIMTAQEVAFALGFADPAYFTRFFARESGETPRQFRERERTRQQVAIEAVG